MDFFLRFNTSATRLKRDLQAMKIFIFFWLLEFFFNRMERNFKCTKCRHSERPIRSKIYNFFFSFKVNNKFFFFMQQFSINPLHEHYSLNDFISLCFFICFFQQFFLLSCWRSAWIWLTLTFRPAYVNKPHKS